MIVNSHHTCQNWHIIDKTTHRYLFEGHWLLRKFCHFYWRLPLRRRAKVTCYVSSLSYYTELGKNWFRRKAEKAFLLWFSLIFSKMISGWFPALGKCKRNGGELHISNTFHNIFYSPVWSDVRVYHLRCWVNSLKLEVSVHSERSQ